MIRLTGILDEIGSGTAKPFPIQKSGHNAYRAKSKNYTYHIMLGWERSYTGDLEEFQIDFGIVTGRKQEPYPHDVIDYTKITNAGELYQIMATVIAAVGQHKKEWEGKGKTPIYYFEPAKTKFETDAKKEGDKTKRGRLYMAFVNRHPFIKKNFIAKTRGNRIYLVPKSASDDVLRILRLSE